MFPRVFIGTATNYVTCLTDLVRLRSEVSAGRIGLYMHNTGMAKLTSGERQRIVQAWGSTGGGKGRDLGVGEVSEFSSSLAADSEAANFPDWRFPLEVNINVHLTGIYRADRKQGDRAASRIYPGYMSASDLTAIKRSIDWTAHDGAVNAAIFVTPNAETQDLDDPFATSGYWANVRSALLYAGGLAVDSPPTFWARIANPKYRAMVEQQIAWAKANNLRVSAVISPYPIGGRRADAGFLHHTRSFVGLFSASDLLPTEWVAENYGNPGNGDNDLAGDRDGAPGLETVALFLAGSAPVAPPATERPLFPGGEAQGALASRMAR